ncbi:hypothetical protein N7G274_001276 [Stereocaulon virgatum]|uniref:Midasin n=1 Tax=Stereocaulon virgatum TaxID=373712 RepID=A0ABR4AND7_9LECA
MDISACSAHLLLFEHSIGGLSGELDRVLGGSSNIQYLDTLSQLALDPERAIPIFTTHEPVFVEICGRWLADPDTDDLSALATLARVLPSAPYLSPYAEALLARRRHGALQALASQRAASLQDLPLVDLHSLLLAIYRLLAFDNNAFASLVSPAQLQLLLSNTHRHIRYLAIRTLCLYLHVSDVALTSMTKTYIGVGEIAGPWEEKTIDYTFFTLWENQRLENLGRKLRKTQIVLDPANYNGVTMTRVLKVGDLSKTTAFVAGILLPRLNEQDSSTSSLVMTETTTHNMHSLAEGVKGSTALLVTGVSGSGKTSLIRDIARELGQKSTMITLHLNEQTDAKLLIGMYTSDQRPGSFIWRPGVLTKAVSEGRWLMIEDLDRAPTAIISTLLPLLERRELLIPNRGETIRAAPGFKLIATVRSTMNSQGEFLSPMSNMIGFRHWLHIHFQTPSDDEFIEIVLNQYPVLRTYIPRFLEVYRTCRSLEQPTSRSMLNPIVGKPLGPQNLLRWCRRVHDLLRTAGIHSGDEPISEAVAGQTFLEAVDCFLGALPPGSPRLSGVNVIAQALHMSAERVQYWLTTYKPKSQSTASTLQVGRVTLSKNIRARDTRPAQAASPFAQTTHVLRLLESIAVTVKQAEPCLLIGETGTGKTRIVQHLANALNQKLTVVNLSQQSEARDLLGGYKPVSMRALALPMKEEFDDLMDLTPFFKGNKSYLEGLGKFIAERKWRYALSLWQNVLRAVEICFKRSSDSKSTMLQSQPKTNKLQSPKLQNLHYRWDQFASQVQTFQMHLASGSKGFAFSFVESNIIKAARNGEWVLLDEINLAAPDTLESLADLFSDLISGGPSILLTETGDTERIYAHKSFRIFGAMNPATDIGKHDLPVSVRSRFTELYIEAPDKDLEDLISVVETYLGSFVETDPRAPTDVAHLYLEIRHLNDSNQLVDGANQKPHFSLRTLTRTLVYALDMYPVYGLRRALFEGFSMSFLTVLSRDSELLVQPRIDKHILGSQNVKAILHQNPRLPTDGKIYIRFKHYWIARGTETIKEQLHYVFTHSVERNFSNLVRATSTRRFPVLLQGPTSSGKTSMIEFLANMSGNKFVRINNHEHTDLQEYLGGYSSAPDGRLVYQDGVLVHALREGYWVVLDELNLAPTDVLEALNRLLDDNRELLIPETQQVVRPHPGFMLFATQNPPGLYGGRKALSRAFRNRFLELHFDDIPEDELETILKKRSHKAPSFCKKIVTVYKQLSILRQSERLFEQKNSFATLRDLFRWASRDVDLIEQLAVSGFLLLAERVRNQDERLAVKQVIENVMKVKIDVDKVYSMDTLTKSLGSSIATAKGIVWTKSMRRLAVLVAEAVRKDEPVLLVGETGLGKTTICQAIADIMNTELHIVNAHQNMETGDLIGSQRPVRNKAHAESQLAQELISVLKDCFAYKDDLNGDIPTLLEVYEALQRQSPAKVPDEVRRRIEQGKTRVRTLFEWADSSLVHAMQDGHLFLLDEISLADDSVLERLNSVLESGRTLFLAEKGTTNALIKASPGFKFLATMNPGGDYGKRELSPALRNRFTEIWVPQVSDEDEMLEIAQAKLIPSRKGFAQSMVKYAAWFAATYTPTAPHISIRDLLAWIHFVNTLQATSLDLALLHGAAMVYIDSLGANPASRMFVAVAGISKERGVCLRKLDECFERDLSSKYYENYMLSQVGAVFSIGPFTLRKRSDMVPKMPYSLHAPTTATNALKIVRALQSQKPILLEGSPGVGKTTLVAALAQTIGMPLTRINLSDQTDLMDLFGSDVPLEGAKAGNFGWRDAPFLRAMQKGEWVLLDEMNLASQSVLEGLNACLDHRGQVYISELDQTFQRHRDFVVFAAQNPHHQGGGRKGLPASFVNRFIVVYTDNFTPEDLLIISNEIYPGLPHHTIETTLQCVTALSQRLQQHGTFGATGGSWEINLRDVLRWLHLLSSQDGLLSCAKSEDFLDLLFLQRFRTGEDVVVASQILQQYLPRSYSHSSFSSKSEGLLEIGFGLLPRDRYFKIAAHEPHKNRSTTLPIEESVMLCIQNNWPCLLVGASGSGKTNLVHKLASSVGADIVDLSLNSEMDTMDLVGGYEQLDLQSQATEFIRRLREYTRIAVIERVESGIELDEHLVSLETKLRASKTSLPEISQLIKRLAEEHPFSAYPDLLGNFEKLTQQSSAKNRTLFEWVDGILVRALKAGKWLVLDNANMCNPSVLDRLNSLLEPNGLLSVNERRNADGSPQVIRPHPNFRLFMTMDPRYGELSRAMRNRSIELFMPVHASRPRVDVLGSNSESTVFHFELLQAFDWSYMTDAQFDHTLALCFDHLSFEDMKLCDRWQMQITKGLIDLPSKKQLHVSTLAKLYQQMVDCKGKTLNNIKAMYDKLDRDLGLPQDLGKMQTIQPLNNPILLSMTSENQSSSNLRWLGNCFELLIEIYRIRQALTQTAEQAESKLPAHMSRLERSIASANVRSFRSDSTQPLASFMQDVVLSVRQIVDGEDSGNASGNQEFLSFAAEVVAYLRDIFDLAQSSDFDEAAFQTYQAIGRSICARASTSKASGESIAKLGSALNSKLDTFDSSWQLHSGFAMEKLWTAFKPATAKDSSQLDFSHKIRGLAARFDALKWSSGASVQELHALQNSIARIHDSVNSICDEDFGPLEDVRKSIEELESHSDSQQADTIPYLGAQFEMLCQYQANATVLGSPDLSSIVALLGGRSTTDLIEFGPSSYGWNTLSQLQRMTATSQSSTGLAAVRNTLPVSLLHKLGNISEVSLQSLALLRTELDVMAQTVAKSAHSLAGDHISTLYQVFKDLSKEVEKTLSIQPASAEHEAIKGLLKKLPYQRNGRVDDHSIFGEDSEPLHVCLQTTIEPRLPKLGLTTIKDDEEMLSFVFVQFFMGCLLLYVPDRPFDPALRLMVEQNRHRKRKMELEVKAKALQDFELVFTGQVTSFRVELAKQSLQALGSEPQIPSVARPRVSGVQQLQAEFNNVLNTVASRFLTLSALKLAFQGQASSIHDVKLSRSNIAKAIDRLSTSFHAYEDVTRPLIAMLQGLDLGLALALLTGTQPSAIDRILRCLCESTPFLGARPSSIIRTNAELESQRTASFDSRFHYLETIAVARSVSKDQIASSTRTIFKVCHSLYQEWKEQLDRGQQENAAKSSWYRYRGGEEVSNEADDQDFVRLFPTYDSREKECRQSVETTFDAQVQAQRLASLQRQIFRCTESASQNILNMLRNVSRTIASMWQDENAHSKSPVPAEDMLSAVIISLEESIGHLHGQATPGKLYNFYTDVNLLEVQKLIDLVSKIQTRFIGLQESWPEHATLVDVLRTSSETVALRHTEPIAKLLTKAEQLHGYVHEWQVVASKEYSAASLYDRLTDLLISWRRLELSTWARLLDMQDDKCHKDADSWWFIAYEVIVAVPLSMVDARDDLRSHAEGMFSTLADFLTTTSMGQYSHRLEMVGCFESYLDMLVQEVPAMTVIHSTLVNFLSYYTRFRSAVQESLSRGRQTLEKALKEILLLASWKDTNINALRDSAKRSHHKLFKVVRKYRALLAQPSENILAQGYFENSITSDVSSTTAQLVQPPMMDLRALQLCQQHIPSWKNTPERFLDPSSTATRMLQVSQLPALVVDASSYLDSFCVELVESMKTLQQETPTKATKDNNEALKYLKERKRKLYAGTLKELRQLGFRSNMSSNVIAKQASISIILTSTPTLLTSLCLSDMYAAEHHFFKLLDMMPLVRERSRNHSEDLTHGEVRRSLGYLESMISTILRQRVVIANASTDLDHLDKTIKHMQSLWAPSSYTLTKQNHAAHDAQDVWYVLGWLPGILEAGCIIIEKHARLSDIDVSTVIQGLMHWKDKITIHMKTFHALPELPRALSSSQHEQAYARAKCAMRDLKAHLHVVIEENPGLAFVLKQIGHWTRVETASPGRITQDDSNAEAPRPPKRRKTESVHASEEKLAPLERFSNSILAILDSILVAIQRMPEACTSIPATQEDAAWFVRTDEYLAEISRGLGAREVNVLLNNTLSKLQHLSASDGVLDVAAAVSAMAMPIIQQYRNIQQTILARHIKLHQTLCKLSSLLARSFSQIIAGGFCNPPEESAPDEVKSGKLEEGTGLGEGEGTEDISKDVEDDEDLSELAQQGRKERHGEEIEDQEDAINMDQDELEGELGNMSENWEEDGAASDRKEDEIDEGTGDVDDLDPTAVDEKLWNGRAGETEKEKEGPKSKGQNEKNERAAAELSARQENSQDEDVDDETSQESAEEGEEVSKEETEKMDPHAQDGRNLDLPDEMDLDNVDGIDAEVGSRDSDMDGMSDVEQEQSTEEMEIQDFEDRHEDESDMANTLQSQPGDVDDDEGEADEANEVASPVDTEPGDEHEDDDQVLLPDYSDNVAVDHNNIAPSDVRVLGDDTESQNEDKQAPTSQAQAGKGSKNNSADKENAEAAAKDGEIGSSLDRLEQGQAEKETLIENSGSQAFKKLGDALERWHRRRQIQNASERQDEAQPQHADVEMADQDFEHLLDESKDSDIQALGAATDEQARALDANAMDSELHDQLRSFLPEELCERGADHQEHTIEHTDDKGGESDTHPEKSRLSTYIAKDLDRTQKQDQAQSSNPQNEEDIQEVDNDFSSTHLEPSYKVSNPSAEEARLLWSHYDIQTRDLSFAFTEQLRLILAPTLATKMRGDFRTGKRLNIKRIIPYIASQYKRDKIWMRRSIPSKRNYQIMLAVDDSKSMGESGSGQLALETLTLVSKSLSMLEVGEICVVGFGNDFHVAHDFGKPFSSEAGVQIFQHFSFQQTKTNVRKLIAESILLFHEARRRTFNAGIDLWQLELIISDGICEDRETIRRLVRQAQEERIMIVFVIVDALVKGESILDMREAVYGPDAIGEIGLKMKRYLDEFPFPYYLVVGNVRELPGVLAQALRQWFTEVVDSG